MTLLSIDKNASAKTLAVTAEFDAPVESVWELWADPRLLERWWGPPEFATTVEHHDLTPGGRITHFMTSPDGEKFPAEWSVLAVEVPRRLVLADADVDAAGVPNDGNGITRMEITIEPAEGRTRMVVTSVFASTVDMEKELVSGFEAGMRQIVQRIEAVLAEVAA